MTKETNNKEKIYIPFYYDALFYKIFGDDKDTSLLKRLIELSLNIKVKSIKILNGKLLSDKNKGKVSYLDLLVELDDESKVSIEVNTNTEYYIKDRNLYFLAKCMSNDMKVGDTYFDLKKHYQINLNGSSDRQIDAFLDYELVNKKHGIVFSNKIKIIDLVYFKNICYTNGDIKSLSEFEKLMGLLGCQKEEEQKFFENEKGMIEVIMKKADKFRDDSEMIEMYDRDVMLDHMRRKELNDALAKNTEAVTNSITNKIVINMIRENANIDFISKTTGLSIEEINKIKKDLN
jgi:predicted transposase/invertase (TIGR01784 family)